MTIDPRRAAARPVAVPDPPSIPELVFRSYAGPADIPAMAAANQAAREAAGALEVVTPESMANTYANLANCDPARDIVVVERAGRLIGYARVSWHDLFDGSRELETYCLLRPDERGRGIGRALLGWAQGRLTEIAAGLPANRPEHLGTWAWEADRHAASLLTADGWTLGRRAHELLRPDLASIPELPLPAGLEIRPIGWPDARRLYDAMVDGFRDHPGEPEPEEADFTEFRNNPRQDPGLWLIAFDGDEIAGGAMNMIEPLPDGSGPGRRGLVDALFTRLPWRRRGLARALLARSLVLLRNHGMTDAYIGVDASNPNQAIGLYESVGFRVVSTECFWSKPFQRTA